MSEKELLRIKVLENVLKGNILNKEAAKQMNLSIRQVQRIKHKYQIEGIVGIIHKNRGKESNHKILKKEEIENILKEKYADFGPTLAKEYLAERDNIIVSKESIRQIQINLGLWKPKKKKDKVKYRSWREPRPFLGSLIQFDGSYEYWFEDRADKCCLLASIDDATGRLMHCMFVKGNESINNVFAFWKEYINMYGKPESIYVDRFSTYKQNAPTPREDIKTQFGRVMANLSINIIFAHSPQAKGRIERVFQSLQDRLIKAMRIDNVNDIKSANIYLKKYFIPTFNKQFARTPLDPSNKHTKTKNENLDEIFSIEYFRVIDNDWTISFLSQFIQLEKHQKVYIKPKEKILVYKTLDNKVILKSMKNLSIPLNYHFIQEKVKKVKVKENKERVFQSPSDTHPWKHSDPYLYHRG